MAKKKATPKEEKCKECLAVGYHEHTCTLGRVVAKVEADASLPLGDFLSSIQESLGLNKATRPEHVEIKERRKVKVTIEGTYDLIPENYPNAKTAEEMVKLDEENPNLGVEGLVDSLENVKVKFELEKETK